MHANGWHDWRTPPVNGARTAKSYEKSCAGAESADQSSTIPAFFTTIDQNPGHLTGVCPVSCFSVRVDVGHLGLAEKPEADLAGFIEEFTRKYRFESEF